MTYRQEIIRQRPRAPGRGERALTSVSIRRRGLDMLAAVRDARER